MAGNPYLWSTTAATNSNADSDINWVEGQLPSTVNDSARGMMAGVAGWLKDTNSTLTTGGSANAQTVTSNVAYTALATGIRLHLKAGFTNTAACTLNLTPAGGGAFGAKSIKIIIDSGEIDPVANNIRANGHYVVEYDAAANAAVGAWILLNPSSITPAAPTVPGLVFISAQTAAVSATINFTTGLDSTYDEYLITGSNIHLATNAVDFWLRVSENAGGAYKSAGTDYRWTSFAANDTPTGTTIGAAADSKITLNTNNSSTAANSLSFWVRLFSPSNTTSSKLIICDVVDISSTPGVVRWAGGGAYIGTTNAVNAIQFLSSSGNITSGNFHLYGVRKV